MAKGPSPQPWQVAASATPPPSGKQPPSPGLLRQMENAATPAPAAPTAPPIPTDPKGFQQYLNDHGANPPLTVDGIVGPKTLAAAQKLNVVVPPNLAPKPASAPVVAAHVPPSASSPSASPLVDVASQSAPVEVPRATIDEIKARYGYLGSLLDQPDVASVIAGYDSTVDSDDQLLARLKSTPTFQNHSQNELNWIALKPADQQAAITTKKADIAAQARQLGISVGDDRLTQMATDALRLGWDNTQITNAVTSEFHYQPGGQTGKIGQAESQLKQMAAAYLMPVSDATLANWDAQVAAGADPQQFQQDMINFAKARYPTVAGMLDKGATMLDIATPYRQTAANTLGINGDAIDFTDPKWSRVFQGGQDKQGNFTMLSDYDWQKLLKTDSAYGWQTSEPGKSDARLMAFNLLKELGKVA